MFGDIQKVTKSKIIPQPFALSANRTVWDRVELEAWLEKKKENRGFIK